MARLVVKLGSSSIASGDGLALNVIAGLINQVAVMQRAGHEILLVTSGAARLGERLLAFEGPTASAAPALRGLVDALRSSIAASGPAGEGGVADNAHERLVARSRPRSGATTALIRRPARWAWRSRRR